MKGALVYLGVLFVVMIVVGVIHFLPWWVLLVLIALVIFRFLVFVVKDSNRMNREFKRCGFRVRLRGNDYFFEELHEGAIRDFPVLPYVEGADRTFRIPDLTEWGTKPEWTANRREEIIRKMSRWMKPACFKYPPDWNYTPREKAKEEAEKRGLERYIERAKRDYRIGESDSEWDMKLDEDGIPSVFRKTPGGKGRS